MASMDRTTNELVNQLALVFDHTADMLCLLTVIDVERFRVELVNCAATRYAATFGFDLNRESVVGMDSNSAIEIAPQVWREEIALHVRYLREAVRMREVVSFESRVGDTAEPLWVEVLITPVHDGQADVSHVLWSARDVTSARRDREERGRLEAQLRHVQKLESLGVLAGGIAHDFNNILTAIIGFTELAAQQVGESSTASGYLNEVIKSSRRAADLCKQMLAYSGKGRLLSEHISLNDLVREMAAVLDVAISKKAVVRLDFDPASPMVDGDSAQIQQVVLNLIMNASDALGQLPGVISISTRTLACTAEFLASTWLNDQLAEGEYAVLEVADTGCGMDESTRLRIFDPFFSTKFPGRGLGLASVMGIVRAHRGAIQVESERGDGTTIRIYLPLATRRMLALPPRRPVNAEHGGGLILFVDDEPSLRALGEELLMALGYGVVTAEDGQDAVNKFRRHRGEFSLVILDLTMPRMGGEEAFHALREIDPCIPILLSSGFDAHETGQRLQRAGLSGFIQKPYQLHVLASAVGAAMAAARIAESSSTGR